MTRISLHSLAAIGATLVLLSSCGKKEGAIVTKERIDKIVSVENRYEDGTLFYTTGSYVSEKWNWDGKELYRIDYGGNGAYSENLFYDNRHRLASTTVPAYRIRSEFVYDGRQLDRIDYFMDDNLFSSLTFKHNDKELVEIVRQIYHVVDSTTLVKSCLLPFKALFGVEAAGIVNRLSEACMERQAKDDSHTVTEHYKLTWEDDNVTVVSCSIGDEHYEISLSYDDKNNPYRYLLGYHESDNFDHAFRLSENNIVSITLPDTRIGASRYSYTYSYDGKFPTNRTLSYSYPSINTTTWDSVNIRCEMVETIEYME